MIEEAIIERAQKAIDERVFPGCVVGRCIADGGRIIIPLGSLTYERVASEVRAATVYDLASVTKSIPVASLALAFTAEGKFALADPVATICQNSRMTMAPRSKISCDIACMASSFRPCVI